LTKKRSNARNQNKETNEKEKERNQHIQKKGKKKMNVFRFFLCSFTWS